MVETLVLDYLNSALAVPCFMETPEKRPGRFVVIEKTGSKPTEHLIYSTLAIKSYGPSLFDAAQLSREVVTAMAMLPLLDEVSRCDLNSEYNYTDTGSKNYRYQAVFDIVHY